MLCKYGSYFAYVPKKKKKRLLNLWINHVHLPVTVYTFELQRTTGEQCRNMQLLAPEFILREDSTISGFLIAKTNTLIYYRLKCLLIFIIK